MLDTEQDQGMVWAWQFDPLEPERGVEITYGGKACAMAPTLNNADLLCEYLNRHDTLAAQCASLQKQLNQLEEAAQLALDYLTEGPNCENPPPGLVIGCLQAALRLGKGTA